MKHIALIIIVFSFLKVPVISQSDGIISFNSKSQVSIITYTTDKKSNYYIVGLFKDSLFHNNEELLLTSSSMDNELFVCKLNNKLELLEIEKFGNVKILGPRAIKCLSNDTILLAIKWERYEETSSELILIDNSLQIIDKKPYKDIIYKIYVINDSEIYIHTIKSVSTKYGKLVNINLNMEELWSTEVYETAESINSGNYIFYKCYNGDAITHHYIGALKDENVIDFQIILDESQINEWNSSFYVDNEENLIFSALYLGEVDLWYTNDTISLLANSWYCCDDFCREYCPSYEAYYTRVDTAGQKLFFVEDYCTPISIDYKNYIYDIDNYFEGNGHFLNIYDAELNLLKSIPLPNTRVLDMHHSSDSMVLFLSYTDQIYLRKGTEYINYRSLGDGDILIIKIATRDLCCRWITSIDDSYITDLNVNIYPNPAESSIEIVSEEPNKIEQVQIFSMSGMLIKSFDVNAIRQKIDISSLGSGLYLVHISVGDTIIVRKLIVI